MLYVQLSLTNLSVKFKWKNRKNEMLFDVLFMKLQLPVKNSEDREAKKAVVVHIHKREKKRNMAKHEIYENVNVMQIL